MQDARGSQQEEKNKNENAPPPPKNHGENTGKTRQGEPTNPERKKRHQGGGREKRGKGNPTNPERNRKTPLDAERKEPAKHSEIAWGKHLLELIQLEEARAQRQARAQVVEKKKQNNKNTTPNSCRQSVLLNLVVLKITVVGTMHPHPGTPKQRKQRTLQGRSLKSSKYKIEVPKHQTICKFPKHESQTLTRYQTHKSTALRKTRRGGGAHGPPRFSGESFRGTLVPRSRSSPTKVTAPGNAVAFKIR